MKTELSIIATALTIFAYIPYYRDTLKKKTHPHLYSWTLRSAIGIINVALQAKEGAGLAVLVTISATAAGVGIAILSIKFRDLTIAPIDQYVIVLALTSFIFWLIFQQNEIAAIFAVSAQVLAFIPTIRKSFVNPFSETLVTYSVNTIRFCVGLIAIEEYNLITVLWFATFAIVNGAFALFLIYRRKSITSNQALKA